MTLSLLNARDNVQRHFFASSLSHINSFALLGQTPSLIGTSLRILLRNGLRANLLALDQCNQTEFKLTLECIAQPPVLDFLLKTDPALADALAETVLFLLRAPTTAALCAADPVRICAPVCRIVLRSTARTANFALTGELAEFFVARIEREAQCVMLREAIASAQCKFLKSVIDYSRNSDVRRALIATELHDALIEAFSHSRALPAESDARDHLIELFANVATSKQIVSLFRHCVTALVAAERNAAERNAVEAPTRAVDMIKTLCSLASVEAQLACYEDVRKQLVENAREIDLDDQERAMTVAMLRCSDALRAACAPEFKIALFGSHPID
jgi:Rps23 Pro-64 3,4-dihydroxylase Tpa1-like proline 4-hydroxylase